MPVYLLLEDNTEAMALDSSEENFDGLFGVEHGDWPKAKEYTDLSTKNSANARESGFINSGTNTFAIYQLKDGEELRYRRLIP